MTMRRSCYIFARTHFHDRQTSGVGWCGSILLLFSPFALPAELIELLQRGDQQQGVKAESSEQKDEADGEADGEADEEDGPKQVQLPATKTKKRGTPGYRKEDKRVSQLISGLKDAFGSPNSDMSKATLLIQALGQQPGWTTAHHREQLMKAFNWLSQDPVRASMVVNMSAETLSDYVLHGIL